MTEHPCQQSSAGSDKGILEFAPDRHGAVWILDLDDPMPVDGDALPAGRRRWPFLSEAGAARDGRERDQGERHRHALNVSHCSLSAASC